MCGRYSLTPTRAAILDEFNVLLSDLLDKDHVFERYNIAPTQRVAVIVPGDGGRKLTTMRWGLIPAWMKPQPNGKPPAGWINARADTAATKPAFRSAYKRRRCVVPASGFYEWKAGTTPKQPYLIRPADDRLMAFAGLWETWQPPEGDELHTVTILTTDANAMMREIHDRMPVILDPGDYDRWMAAAPDEAEGLAALLAPVADGLLYKVPVSTRVNSPRYDDYGCCAPLPHAT